jgi:hypothetical protein
MIQHRYKREWENTLASSKVVIPVLEALGLVMGLALGAAENIVGRSPKSTFCAVVGSAQMVSGIE